MRFLSAFCAGALAWFVGKAIGVPVWQDWVVGDRCDMALTAYAIIWFGIGANRSSHNESRTTDRGGVNG